MTVDTILEEIRQATSIRAGALALERVGAMIDLPKVGCAHDISLPAGPEDDEGVRLADIWGWPHPFAEEWEEQHLTLHAPFFLRCRFEHLPFAWSARVQEGQDSSRREKMVVRFLTSIGYANALVVPVHLPQGRIAAVSWWGELAPDAVEALIARHGPVLLAISHYFIEILGNQALPQLGDKESSPPSVREIECLTFAAQGMSDVEIAYEMQISVHTVRYYINTVTRRLGARNRTHAVALASQLGIIGMSKSSHR